MGSRNSKSNSSDKNKENVSVPDKQNLKTNNLDESSLDNSIEDTSTYKGIILDKKNKNINNIKNSENYNSDEVTQEKTHSDNNSSFYFNIIWSEGGNEIYIIGAFCAWKKKTKMKKSKKNYYEKEIPIPHILKERYQFKFIVDDEWKYSELYPKTKDEQGNINNYIDQNYINEHLYNLKNKNNETINSTKEKNIKYKLSDNSKDSSNKSIYGNIYPNDENQEAPKMPDVLDVCTNLTECSNQKFIGKKKYLKYSPINLCSSYKNIFLPGHSYINHLLTNKNNIMIKTGKYFRINCSVKNKGKCLSILYFSPIDKNNILSID